MDKVQQYFKSLPWLRPGLKLYSFLPLSAMRGKDNESKVTSPSFKARCVNAGRRWRRLCFATAPFKWRIAHPCPVGTQAELGACSQLVRRWNRSLWRCDAPAHGEHGNRRLSFIQRRVCTHTLSSRAKCKRMIWSHVTAHTINWRAACLIS